MKTMPADTEMKRTVRVEELRFIQVLERHILVLSIQGSELLQNIHTGEKRTRIVIPWIDLSP